MAQTVLVRDSTQPAGSQQSFTALPAAAMAAGAAAANLGAHGVTSLMLAAEFLAMPRLVKTAGVRIVQSAGANDYAMYMGSTGTANATSGTFAQAGGPSVFYFDPAVYALTGLTLKCTLNAILITNAVAPTVTFVVGIYPVSSVAGANGINAITVGSVTAASLVTFTTPAATSTNQGTSGAFAALAAGYYSFGVNVSGTAAASSTESISADLLISWV